jgi:hypothetical protein
LWNHIPVYSRSNAQFQGPETQIATVFSDPPPRL